MLLQQVQSMQHRSKDAYPNDRKVPIHDPYRHDADKEVENYKLERTTVIKPFIKGSCFPDGVEVKSIALELGTTAPEMMLLPYMSEPATGSRIPSMSTGGAAMKATIKQMVAANRVGIIRTPNQPTYRRLLVEVTHSQNDSQVLFDCCLERVVAIVLNEKVRPSGKWWSYYFLAPLREDMKDVIYTP